MDKNDSPYQLLTVKQIAELFQITGETVRRWRRRGLIKGLRIGPGKTLRFKKEDVENLIKKEE